MAFLNACISVGAAVLFGIIVTGFILLLVHSFAEALRLRRQRIDWSEAVSVAYARLILRLRVVVNESVTPPFGRITPSGGSALNKQLC